MFNEYFHGDNGAGLGASHQTGWTGVVADVIRRRHGDVGSLGEVLRDRSPVARRRNDRASLSGSRPALPGSPFPLGATPSRRRQLRGGVRDCRRDLAVPLRRARAHETRVPLQDSTPGVWHGFVPGVGPGQAYGYRATGPYDPARGAALQPGQAAHRPLRAGHRRLGAVRSRGRSATPRGDPDSPSELDSAAFVPRSLVVDPALRVERPSPAPPPLRGHGHLRGSRQGLHHDPPRRPAGPARHLRRARSRGGHRPPGRPRGDRGRAAPGPPERARSLPLRTGASPTTGATTPSGTSPPTAPTRRRYARSARGPGAPSSRRWSTLSTAPGSR